MDKSQFQEGPKLNLVALMDIFTILVFFLMVNSGDVEVMQADSSLELPQAYAEEVAGPSLNITLVNDALLVQGRKIIDIKNINLELESIPQLRAELEYQAKKRPALVEEESKGRSVTLFADKSLEYEVLRLILATCSSTEYRDLSMAVEPSPTVNPSVAREVKSV